MLNGHVNYVADILKETCTELQRAQKWARGRKQRGDFLEEVILDVNSKTWGTYSKNGEKEILGREVDLNKTRRRETIWRVFFRDSELLSLA